MALAKDRMPHNNESLHPHHPHLSNSAGFVFSSAASASNCYQADEEDHDSVINFSNAHDHDSSNCIDISCDDFKCFRRAASNYNSSAFNPSHGSSDGSAAYGWLYSSLDPNLMADSFIESEAHVGGGSVQKRPHKGESMQPIKRQCTSDVAASTTKKPKPKSSSPSKDPQSIAAKNRRERISERLKILQELVPNGCKVDLVTMLEKAISYVKFLQLQVKVLATDEIWPVQGGKAPDISQVKEAIDAILSSQRDTSSSSKLCPLSVGEDELSYKEIQSPNNTRETSFAKENHLS